MQHPVGSDHHSYKSQRAGLARPGDDVRWQAVLAHAHGKVRPKGPARECELTRRLFALTWIATQAPKRVRHAEEAGKAIVAIKAGVECLNRGDVPSAGLACQQATQGLQLAWLHERRFQEFARRLHEANAEAVSKPKLRPVVRTRAPRRPAHAAGRPRARRSAPVARSSSSSDDPGPSDSAGDLHRHANALQEEARRRLPSRVTHELRGELADRVAAFRAECEAFYDSFGVGDFVRVATARFPDLTAAERWPLAELLTEPHRTAVLAGFTRAAA